MRKTVFTAFRDKPGGSCGHHHKTRKAALVCAKKHGKGWYVSSYQISH